MRLLLESTLRLDGQLGRPAVGENKSQQNNIANIIVVRSFGRSHILNDPAPGYCRYKRTCRLGMGENKVGRFALDGGVGQSRTNFCNFLPTLGLAKFRLAS